MTNEEALNILEKQLECDNENCPEPWMSCSECPYNVDAIDYDEARKMAIEALSKQCASSEQAGKDIKFPTIHCCRGYDCIKDENGRTGFGVYDPQEKNIYIAGDVPKEIFLKALFHEIFHWIQDVAGMKFNEDDANSFSDILYDAVDMFDNHGPELFGQKTIVEPGEQFIGEDLLKEALDQNADSGKTIVLKKRTITERLIIAKSLIDSVIADSESDQFREDTKKIPDVPDTNVGDMISRQAAICAVSDACFELRGVFGLCEDALKALPSAQPERKTGRWIYGVDDVAMCDGYHCSECGFFVPWDYKHKFIYFIKDYNFCPNCGAKMLKTEN